MMQLTVGRICINRQIPFAKRFEQKTKGVKVIEQTLWSRAQRRN